MDDFWDALLRGLAGDSNDREVTKYFVWAGSVVILGLVLWSCYCCESCPMYDHWNPRAKEKRTQNLQQPIIGGTYQQPTQVGTVVP